MTSFSFPSATLRRSPAKDSFAGHHEKGAPLLSPKKRAPFFLRTELDRLLTVSIAFSCVLVVLRAVHTDRFIFLFMIWNLFLAYIPYALSNWLTASPRAMQQPFFRYALFGIWLLFLPNTFYILTDLYHLHDTRHPLSPAWFDLALIFSCAWNGLFLGVLSMRQMEKIFHFPTAPIMALNALGIYVGRYLRYNSWDIISNPFQLTADIFDMIIHPFRNKYAWDMIACYTILLIMIYLMMKKLSKALG